jgi:Arc/MetJ family transcription regulator
MKATIAIDDELFAIAQKYAGVTEKSAVIRKASKAFVEQEGRAGWPASEVRNRIPKHPGAIVENFRRSFERMDHSRRRSIPVARC